MVHIPYLQPFEAVNKRVSRLAANIPMVRQNLCPLSFVDVPRDDYTHAMLAIYELNTPTICGISSPGPTRARPRDTLWSGNRSASQIPSGSSIEASSRILWRRWCAASWESGTLRPASLPGRLRSWPR